ncbi:hypothetical protein PFISCL1PPCAC_12826, partial [Pristionchus fissidentatus]
YGDFTLNCICVIIVAVLDVCTLTKIHCLTDKHTDPASVQRRVRQNNLAYQAVLQGVFYITELITYFLISGYAQNKWQAFALTTLSWCLVNGMDGLIVLLCNRDFRSKLRKI